MRPDDRHLPAVLDLLSDPARLWSPHGLRSLSKADPLYGRDDDYWRGAVWVNLNVLAVLRLRDLGLGMGTTEDGSEQEQVRARALSLAAGLRRNVVAAVYDSWRATGLFWEQYGDKTGEGRHSRAFTGWTACVILLLGLDLAEADDGGSASGGGGSSSTVTLSSALLIFVSLSLLVTFRRKLRGLALWAMERWRARRRDRLHGRDDGGYEEVVDLDELDGRS
ncbi:hypothetical protein SLS62_006070 [Diatrype stigma]|uniref:Mannosyl-oligosaccharide glucosidase n=1 Tax=Diatrype stigma TaxID=117547 RepID=A0AAN9URB1_9PEZI